MKFHVSLSLIIVLLMVPFNSVFARPKCTCYPSPPGGITECESGQTAVCGDNGRGQCIGRCVSVNTKGNPLRYTAEFLSKIFDRNIEAEDLREEAKDSIYIIDTIVKNNRRDQPFEVEYKKETLSLTVYLDSNTKYNLIEAKAELEKLAVMFFTSSSENTVAATSHKVKKLLDQPLLNPDYVRYTEQLFNEIIGE